jgi:RNA polymerase sigma-70 factor (ECF subfamily)
MSAMRADWHVRENGASPAATDLASADDRQLTIAFKRGERDAFDVIHERYAERVQRVCRRMLGNPDDAEEVAQETFLRVYRALGAFNGRYELGAWIARIATNACLDHIRARSRRPVEPAPVEVLEHESEAVDDGPEAALLRKAESRRVRKVLAGLPPAHRAAIVLRDFEGLSYDEVAVALGIGEAQVKALIYRARQGFKRSWSSWGLAGLVPARFIDRLRSILGVPGADQVGQTTAPASQMAVSCSAMFTQCGQAVTDRVAAVATAVTVSAVAASGAVTGPAPATPTAPQGAGAPVKIAATPTADQNGHVKLRHRPARAAASTGRAAEAAPAPEPSPTPSSETSEQDPAVVPALTPTPTPSPTADDQSSPSPTQGGDPSLPADDDPSPPGAPPSQPPAIGFDDGSGSPLAASEPPQGTTTASCLPLKVDQHLTTTVVYGATTYDAVFNLFTDGSSLSFEMTLSDGSNGVYYPGGATLVSTRKARLLDLSYRGTFGTGDDAEALGLPQSGRIRANLSLDCKGSDMVTETIVLSG